MSNAQATESLALIEKEFASTAAKARPPSLLLTSSQARSSQRMSSALVLASSQSHRTPVPRNEAQRAAISWLDGQERSALSEPQDSAHYQRGAHWDDVRNSPDPGPVATRLAPADTLKPNGFQIRVPPTSPAVRGANSSAASRARVVRQAYETLGVHRNIADENLNRVYEALIQKNHPDNNPPELASYYAKKQKEIQAACMCVRSTRRPSTQLSATRATAQLWLQEQEVSVAEDDAWTPAQLLPEEPVAKCSTRRQEQIRQNSFERVHERMRRRRQAAREETAVRRTSRALEPTTDEAVRRTSRAPEPTTDEATTDEHGSGRAWTSSEA